MRFLQKLSFISDTIVNESLSPQLSADDGLLERADRLLAVDIERQSRDVRMEKERVCF